MRFFNPHPLFPSVTHLLFEWPLNSISVKFVHHLPNHIYQFSKLNFPLKAKGLSNAHAQKLMKLTAGEDDILDIFYYSFTVFFMDHFRVTFDHYCFIFWGSWAVAKIVLSLKPNRRKLSLSKFKSVTHSVFNKIFLFFW